MSRLTPDRLDGWVGVDLDGTLAHYGDGWQGPLHIGEPIPAMQARVKGWIKEGRQVRIVTARVADPDGNAHEATAEIIDRIEAWCEHHLGQKLAVTCKKDYGMIELWDDRAIQVIPNTGDAIESKHAELLHGVEGLIRACDIELLAEHWTELLLDRWRYVAELIGHVEVAEPAVRDTARWPEDGQIVE